MTEKRKTIIRVNHKALPYFLVARSVAQNTELSYEALGLLVYLLSKPDDWQVQPETLKRHGTGRASVYKLLKELREAGHVQRVIQRDDKKHITKFEYVIYEEPLPAAERDLVSTKQEVALQETAKQEVENQHITEYRGVQSTETTTKPVVVVETETLPERPNIFRVYEEQFGMSLTMGIAETLKDMVKEYGEAWATDAITITATSGKRGNLRYAAAILRNWQRDGREPERTPAAPVVVDEATAWRNAQKARPNVRYDAALDMLLPAFKDEDDRKRYITEYLNVAYVPRVEEVAS